MTDTQHREDLGPAERIINALLAYNDHLYHGRPGVVVTDARANVDVRWDPVTHKVENEQKVVYRLDKVGKKTVPTRLGVMREDGKVVDRRKVVGEYREPGLFPEVAVWFYQQVAEVWKLDNEFAARWASFAYPQEHRDLKVVLAAFMLCQSRKGEPIKDGDATFRDVDHREIGEAMLLLRRTDKKDLDPKMLLRVHEVLSVPAVAEVNRKLGFGRSARRAFLGRWPDAITKWLRYREQNHKMLAGLVKSGQRTAVMELARLVGYKPDGQAFFETLRWKQKQAKDGHRSIAIGQAVKAAESWAGLSEEQVCEKIAQMKYDWKRVVSLVPRDPGITRAVVCAALEHGCMSDKDVIIMTPTLEELGLLEVQSVKERWERATKSMEDTRAAAIARNVRSQETKDQLQNAADGALKKAVEEVVKGLQVYVVVDISGSMHESIPRAKVLLAKFLQAFPKDKLHVSAFNTAGREVEVHHASAAGVEAAFRGITAGGGTEYSTGVTALRRYKPADDEDALFIFVGDEGQSSRQTFERAFEMAGIKPVAFGLIKLRSSDDNQAVQRTAVAMGIPCFMLSEEMFADPYAVPRVLRNLVAATPVQAGAARPKPRLTLVDQILGTDLLKRPAWA